MVRALSFDLSDVLLVCMDLSQFELTVHAVYFALYLNDAFVCFLLFALDKQSINCVLELLSQLEIEILLRICAFCNKI